MSPAAADEVGNGSSAPLYDDAYAVLCRADHPAVVDGTIELRGWLDSGHIVVSSEETGGTDVDRALADRGMARTIALRVENALLVPHLVQNTNLTARVDRRLGERLVGAGLVLSDPPLNLRRGRVRMVWATPSEADPGIDWLRRRLHEVAS